MTDVAVAKGLGMVIDAKKEIGVTAVTEASCVSDAIDVTDVVDVFKIYSR